MGPSKGAQGPPNPAAEAHHGSESEMEQVKSQKSLCWYVCYAPVCPLAAANAHMEMGITPEALCNLAFRLSAELYKSIIRRQINRLQQIDCSSQLVQRARIAQRYDCRSMPQLLMAFQK